MGASKNMGTPKSSFLIRFSIINHPFWGTPTFGNFHIYTISENPSPNSKLKRFATKVGAFRSEGWFWVT